MKITPGNVRKFALLAVALILLAALGVVATRMGPFAPIRVTLTSVKHARLTPSVFGIGTVEARQSWLMGPTTAGRVLRVHVDVGQSVKQGQLIAEMDPVDLEQRLQGQASAVARAASLEQAARAQVADTSARRQLARTNLERQQELARRNFISPQALEGRQQELQSAEAALQAAHANLQAALQDAQRLQAERAATAQQRQYSRLLAPADAVVISRDAEPGSTVVAGQPVLRLANPATLWIRLRVDQGRSAGLKADLPARVALRSRPGQVLTGKVERVDPQADAVTEERIAQVRFEAVPAAVSIGEMAEVTLDLEPIEQALVLPQASVRQHQGQTGVWRLKDGALHFAPVQWGAASLDGHIQVIAGLTVGDTVVVYSDKPLSAGVRVRVVEALTGTASP